MTSFAENHNDADNIDGCVLLIMNCEKYANKAERQKRTWLKGLRLPHYHVLGDPDLEDDYVFQDDQHILWVNTKDDYNSLPKKVVASYDAVRNRFRDLKYVFKTDDDQMLQSHDANAFFQRISAMLARTEKENYRIHYAGNIVNVNQAYLSRYHTIHPELPRDLPVMPTKYCSGRFYLLSEEAVDDLLKKRHYIEKEFLEDYAVGYYLDDNYKVNMKHLATNIFFKDFE